MKYAGGAIQESQTWTDIKLRCIMVRVKGDATSAGIATMMIPRSTPHPQTHRSLAYTTQTGPLSGQVVTTGRGHRTNPSIRSINKGMEQPRLCSENQCKLWCVTPPFNLGKVKVLSCLLEQCNYVPSGQNSSQSCRPQPAA